MEKWICEVCGFVYDPAEGDPDNNVAPGTKFEDLPDDWVCPVCGAAKENFAREAQSLLNTARRVIFAGSVILTNPFQSCLRHDF